MKKIILTILIVLFSFSAYADEFESKYFKVTLPENADVSYLYDKLAHIPQASLEVFSFSNLEGVKGSFANSLDNLYLIVCDIMDIHLVDIKVNLVIFNTNKEVADKVEGILKKRVSTPSFFYNDKKVIYISLEGFRAGILGHEIGHFIQCSYFPVPPPEKMQEVLCGYVEYTLLKQTKTN